MVEFFEVESITTKKDKRVCCVKNEKMKKYKDHGIFVALASGSSVYRM